MELRDAQAILDTIVYKNARFYIRDDYHSIQIRMYMNVKDACSGKPFDISPEIRLTSVQNIDDNHWPNVNKEMLLATVYEMCKRIEMHEVMEHFKVNSVCYKEPHPERKHA